MSDPLSMPPMPATPPPLDYESAKLAPGKGGLIAMGVIFFCIGAMTACGTLAIPFSMLSGARPAGPDAATLVLILAFYGAIATAAIWIGVGCCRARRWVRPLVLATAWPWLLMGCVMFVFMIVGAVHAQTQTAVTPGLAPGPSFQTIQTAVMLVSAVMVLIIFVAIPVVLIWFFQRRQTAQTLWFYDPTPGWADRCPIPVLAWSLWLGLGGLGMLGALDKALFPVFGVFLTGAPAIAIILLVAAVMLCTAVGSYLLKPWAWWLALAQAIVFSASWLTLVLRGRLNEYVVQTMPTTGPVAPQLEMIRTPWFLVMSIGGMLIWIGFLVYLRRYFAPPPASGSPQAA